MTEERIQIILDVRTSEEFVASHIKGAHHLDWYRPDFKETVSTFDKKVSYKLYCRSGNRSGQALQLMSSLGFLDLENLGSLEDAARKLKRPCEGPKAS